MTNCRPRGRSGSSRAVALLLAAVAGLVLLSAARPGSRLQGPAIDADRDVVLVAAWAAWALAGYLVCAVAAATIATLPLLRAGAARRLRRLAPASVVRFVELGVGAVSIGAGVAIAVPAPASAATKPMPATSATTVGSLDWPVIGPKSRSSSSTVVVELGDSLWGIAAAQLADPADIAAIARSWPRWYAVNRAVIGADPNLIRPGERLRSPVSPRPGRSQ